MDAYFERDPAITWRSSRRGVGKRVPLAEFPVQGRNGQGVIAAKPTQRTGELAGAALVAPGDLLACLVSRGAVKVVPAANLPETARANMGKVVLALGSGERVTGAYGAISAGVEEPPPPEPKAKKPRAATGAKPAGVVKAAKPAAPVAEPKAEAAPQQKPAAAPTVIASGSDQSAVQREASSEAISLQGGPEQLAPAKGKPAAAPTAAARAREAPPRVPAKVNEDQLPLVPELAGKTKAPMAVPKQAAESPSKRARQAAVETPKAKTTAKPTQATPVAKPGAKAAPAAPAAKPTAKAPSKAPAAKPAAGTPAVPPAKGEAAPVEDVSVKEMQGRTIARADLEKLIRGEISPCRLTAHQRASAPAGRRQPNHLGRLPPRPADAVGCIRVARRAGAGGPRHCLQA
jgi:hypothetical protein